MIPVWVLIVVTCASPSAAGACVQKEVATYGTRPECTLGAWRTEVMDERTRAWCRRETRF